MMVGNGRVPQARPVRVLASQEFLPVSSKLTTEYLRHEARTALACIIENVPEGELQASFMGLPDVEPAAR